jgi:orotate phosphoribosyltransferase
MAPGRGLRGKIDGNFKPDTNVILFDDVTAKDGSVMQAVRARGAAVKKIITLADRLERRQRKPRKRGDPDPWASIAQARDRKQGAGFKRYLSRLLDLREMRARNHR